MTLQIERSKCNGRQEFIVRSKLALDIAVNAQHFDPCYLRANKLVQNTRSGRGSVYFFPIDDTQVVLRHYRRGGLAAKISQDKFFGSDIKSSRVYQELKLLMYLQEQGLPVPHPIAGRVVQEHLFYTADIITQAIADTEELHMYLQYQALPSHKWQELGKIVKKMHSMGVCHDDLNVKNVLVDKHLSMYLIDFDKCYIRKGESWKTDNLSRFRRSLDKHKNKLGVHYHFDPLHWSSFIEGYHATL
ncbi:3-deoxy-D-manno-octulosonic acid kinase [Agaribacter flavus]|uniref:3-deoxy-D-manno-octulosonic acid kinase n=1 Tax=Agaribacter flavus TaxID=1902781 RepID=A0ABV7FXD0_9ALTE